MVVGSIVEPITLVHVFLIEGAINPARLGLSVDRGSSRYIIMCIVLVATQKFA